MTENDGQSGGSELRQISDEELKKVLEEHEKWLESEDERHELQAALPEFLTDDIKEKMLYSARIAEIIEKKGGEGVQADLSYTILDSFELKQVNLRRANLEGAKLFFVDLEEADLSQAHLEGTDLRGAHLEGADLRSAHLEKADLWNAHLEGANLRGAQLKLTDLTGVNLEGANLSQANLEGATIGLANLKGADLSWANFNDAEVSAVDYDRKGKYFGIRIETCYGSPMFKRHAQEQDWLAEFLGSRRTRWQKIWAYFWRETSDYGRSLGRWAICSVLLAVIFGSIFYALELFDSFKVDQLPKYPDPLGLLSMIYYSVVTFTTFGFGDITPNNLPAAGLVMLEVICGYIMLGGLISIFANKLARRS